MTFSKNAQGLISRWELELRSVCLWAQTTALPGGQMLPAFSEKETMSNQ